MIEFKKMKKEDAITQKINKQAKNFHNNREVINNIQLGFNIRNQRVGINKELNTSQ